MTNDISVVLATYNRANDLSRTLEGMVKTERSGISVDLIIVDNGSTDHTKSVVDSFRDRIPIQYLFESRSGKNRALNCALDNGRIGKILVFTDDDIDPSVDWLVRIADTCERWPDHSVFGGGVEVVFPTKALPAWASDPYIQQLGFTYHHYSDKECIYERGRTPFGPNYWIRSDILKDGLRFDEGIGPRPTNRILGDETSFLLGLQARGYEIVHSPSATVGHRIQPEVLRFSAICRRAYSLGRGDVYVYGAPSQTALSKYLAGFGPNSPGWRIYRSGSVVLCALRLFVSFIFSTEAQRPHNVATNLRSLGYRVEAVRSLRERTG